eukprot:scaffold36316_cov114-Isochrysis_galbana.AAC.6
MSPVVDSGSGSEVKKCRQLRIAGRVLKYTYSLHRTPLLTAQDHARGHRQNSPCTPHADRTWRWVGAGHDVKTSKDEFQLIN